MKKSLTFFILSVLAFVLCSQGLLAEAKQVDHLRSDDWHVVAAADFNGDDRDDLLWMDSTGAVEIDFMDGNEVLPSPTASFQSPSGHSFAGIGDVSGDGTPDIAWFEHAVGATFYLMESNGTWLGSSVALAAPALMGELHAAWRLSALGDFDFDGDSDVYWRNRPSEGGTGNNWVAALDYDDQTSQLQQQLHFIRKIGGDKWIVVGVGDFNDDGATDLAWQKDNFAANSAVNLETFSGTSPPTSKLNTLHTFGGASWEVRGAADFLGDGYSDLIVRRQTTHKGWLLETGLDATGEYVARSSEYDAKKFKSSDYDIVTIGDLDGDGNTDSVWRKSDGVVPDETWIWFTRRLRAVHFKPQVTTPLPDGLARTQWAQAIEETCPAPPATCVRDEVRLELAALRDKTGLRQIKVEFGVGKTFDFPDPDPAQLDSVVRFLEILREEGMEVTFNLGNHCWVPDDLLDMSSPSKFLHIGGHLDGECYRQRKGYECLDDCEKNCVSEETGQLVPCCLNVSNGEEEPCPTLACQELRWNMPSCPEGSSVADSVNYYGTILSHLEANVPNLREVVSFINLNGSPIMPSPNEPAAFKDEIYGPDFGDPEYPLYADLRAAISAYYRAVFAEVDSHSLPIGMKSNLSTGSACSGDADYERLRNVVEAVPELVDEIDFYDFTADLTTDIDEILDALQLQNEDDRLATIAFTDMKTRTCAGAPPDSAVANHMMCFFDEVEEQGFLGWWFQTFRENDNGLIDDISTIGPGPNDPAWNNDAIDAIRWELNEVGATTTAACPPGNEIPAQ